MNINQNIVKIPNSIEIFKRILTYTKIDIIMNPDDYSLRVYHYNRDFFEKNCFFSIDDFSGDHYNIVFSLENTFIKGFNHESELSPYNKELLKTLGKHNYYENSSKSILKILEDPSMEKDIVTFFIWKNKEDQIWNYNKINISEDLEDGTEDFIYYTSDIYAYKEWFQEYYEKEIDIEILKKIYDGEKITKSMINNINYNISKSKEESIFLELKDLELITRNNYFDKQDEQD